MALAIVVAAAVQRARVQLLEWQREQPAGRRALIGDLLASPSCARMSLDSMDELLQTTVNEAWCKCTANPALKFNFSQSLVV